MLENPEEIINKIISNRKFDTTDEKDHINKTGNIAPIAAISIITLIGLVCVVIDFYLEKE